MKPFIIDGTFLDSFGTMMVLGFVAALVALMVVTPKSGDDKAGELSRGQVWDLYIVMVIAAVIGSKIGHTLFEAPGHRGKEGQAIHSVWELLADDPWHWAAIGEAGWVWYGGMITALGCAIFYFWRRPHLRAALYADAFAPAIMFGASVGRIGCFLSGCCYGHETDVAWAVKFPRIPGLVHPTQLYDSGIALLLGSFLLWRFTRRKFDGELIAILLMTYPALRSFTEHFRGDADRGTILGLSTSQFLSIPLFCAGAYLYFRLAKNGPPAPLALDAPVTAPDATSQTT
jgi:phosphatidylglycerol---prolipoprotein diacylglyceryl transferase